MTKLFVVPWIARSTLQDPDSRTRWGLTALPRSSISPAPLTSTGTPWIPTGLLSDAVYVKHAWQLPWNTKLLRRLEGATQTPDAFPQWPNPELAVTPTARTIAVPYDFRQPNATSAAWLDRVITAWADDDEEVFVLAHSMGGLVASYWFAALEGYKRCKRLVTVATPFRGAPKALTWLNRVPLPGFSARPTQTLRTWPSLYELLPRYPMIEQAHTPTWLRPSEIPQQHELYPGFLQAAKAGYQFHLDLDAAWEALPPEHKSKLICVMGSRRETPSSARLSEAGLTCISAPPPGVSPDQADGDGTVPLTSAKPWNVPDVPYQAVPRGRHLPIWHSHETVSWAEGAKVALAEAIHGPSTARDTLAVDLEIPDETQANQPFNIVVSVPLDAQIRDYAAAVNILDNGRTTGPPLPLRRVDTHQFATTITLATPGVHTIQAVVAHHAVPHRDEADIAVLPAEEEAT